LAMRLLQVLHIAIGDRVVNPIPEGVLPCSILRAGRG